MPEKLMHYLNLIQIYRNSFDKDLDYDFFNSASLVQMIKMNTAGISFYRRMIEVINDCDIEKVVIEDIVFDLLQLINKISDQNILLKKMVVQRTQSGEPKLVLESNLPYIKYDENCEIGSISKEEIFIDDTNNPIYVTVFNQINPIIYEVDGALLSSFLNHVSNMTKDSCTNATCYQTEISSLDDKINQVEMFVEMFMVSPVAYQVFCEYFKLMHQHIISKKNINEADKILALDDFANTLMLYLRDKSDAFSVFKKFVSELSSRKRFLINRGVIDTNAMQQLIIQNQIDGLMWEQMQKSVILELIEKSNLVTPGAKILYPLTS